MSPLRFKTCRLLSGNVRNRELTIIQRRILRRLRKNKRNIKRKIYPRKDLTSYIQLQTTRKLSLYHGDLPITGMHRGTKRTSYIPFPLNPETRLDVIPLRLHFLETIPQARQPLKLILFLVLVLLILGSAYLMGWDLNNLSHFFQSILFCRGIHFLFSRLGWSTGGLSGFVLKAVLGSWDETPHLLMKMVAPAGTSASSEREEDSFEMNVLLEPFSEDEGTSAPSSIPVTQPFVTGMEDPTTGMPIYKVPSPGGQPVILEIPGTPHPEEPYEIPNTAGGPKKGDWGEEMFEMNISDKSMDKSFRNFLSIQRKLYRLLKSLLREQNFDPEDVYNGVDAFMHTYFSLSSAYRNQKVRKILENIESCKEQSPFYKEILSILKDINGEK